jgi:hypothetical protein
MYTEKRNADRFLVATPKGNRKFGKIYGDV